MPAATIATELDDLRKLPIGTVLRWSKTYFVLRVDIAAQRHRRRSAPGRYPLSGEAVNHLHSGCAILLKPAGAFEPPAPGAAPTVCLPRDSSHDDRVLSAGHEFAD